MFDVNAVFQRAREVEDRAVDRAAVLVRPDDQLYFGVNRVGARIWNLLERPQRVVDIVDALAVEFAVTRDECRRQTEAFLRQLLDRKLIVQRGPACD